MSISPTLQTVLESVPENEIRRALKTIANYDAICRHHPSSHMQSRYAEPKFKLWEACTHKDACHGRRFSYLVWEMVPGSGSTENRFQHIQIDTTKLSAKEKSYWTSLDKIWAWGEYLKGASPEDICCFVGGRKSEFVDWIKAVCRGEKECDYGGSFGDYNDPKGWTPRHDRILWLMYQSRIPFMTARRLLGKSETNTKWRLKLLKEQNGPKR